LAISPTATEANFTELTITDFFKSTDAFPLYLLIVMIFYFVLLHYWRRRFHAFCIDKWFRLGSTCPSCRIIPVAHITPV
ncbi:unnamed protein product, partial [Brassica oleracea var. botrytis]